MLVKRADSMSMPEYSCFVLMCWEFLLRVQSEAVPLLAGMPDDATSLPRERHSGVWVDGSGALCLRLQRRKNRPQGSLLRRRCTCPSQGFRFCVVHRLRPFLAQLQPTEPLWSFDSGAALKKLRRLLTLSQVPSAPEFTFKAFRAGKATALAAAGKSVGTILQAGEWRSAAFLNYVDTDVVDQAQLLDQAMVQSEDEE